MPGSQHDPAGRVAIQLEFMNGRPMRMSVYQRTHAACMHDIEHCFLIHIHDAVGRALCVPGAAGAGASCQVTPHGQR
jgi:hypothetical protein